MGGPNIRITTQRALLGAERVIAVDIIPRLVEIARRRAELDGVSDRVQLICGDLATIEPQPVDIVLSFAVLPHLAEQITPTMSLIRRWLKPGGVFICIEPVQPAVTPGGSCGQSRGQAVLGYLHLCTGCADFSIVSPRTSPLRFV